MSEIGKQPAMSSAQPASRILGDPAAFVRLYRSSYDVIFRYCVHRLFDRHTAEDMTSEVFLKAARHAHRFEGLDETQFRNWLYRVATNEINTHIRKTTRRERLLRFFGQGPDRDVSVRNETDTDDLERLKKAVLALKPGYQAVITLRFTENLTHNEIAGVLDVSPGTVRSRLSRAVAELRARLRTADEKGRREVIR